MTCEPDIVARPAVLRDAPDTLVASSYLIVTSPVAVLTFIEFSFASIETSSPVAVCVCASACAPADAGGAAGDTDDGGACGGCAGAWASAEPYVINVTAPIATSTRAVVFIQKPPRPLVATSVPAAGRLPDACMLDVLSDWDG